MHVYIGTYTNGDSQGIYLFELNPQTGELTPKGLAAEAKNPSFLAIHPNKQYLYAVSEVSDAGKKAGAVAAFRIDPKTGKLTEINRQLSGGAGPCHVTIDRTGQAVVVANYGGGSIASLPVKADGSLGEAASVMQHEGSSANPQRQKEPHAHSVNVDAGNNFIVAADLGIDKLMVYRLDPETAKLQANDPPSFSVHPGGGPRHFTFHPKGRYAYVINELDSTVTAMEYDPQQGAFKELQTVSTLPKDFDGNNTTAEVQVHPSGKFLYGSNRGHDSIAIFRIDDSGKLTPVGHESTQGKTPRNFGVDPTGSILIAANQDTNNLVVFKIDQETGKLQATGQTAQVGRPVCVKFLPKGK